MIEVKIDSKPAPNETEASEVQSIENSPIAPVPKNAMAACATVLIARSPE